MFDKRTLVITKGTITSEEKKSLRSHLNKTIGAIHKKSNSLILKTISVEKQRIT